MRTTLDLPQASLDELVRVAGARTKGQAVTLAIEEYLRRRKREDLKAASGKVRLANNWQELEEAELKDAVGGPRRSR